MKNGEIISKKMSLWCDQDAAKQIISDLWDNKWFWNRWVILNKSLCFLRLYMWKMLGVVISLCMRKQIPTKFNNFLITKSGSMETGQLKLLVTCPKFKNSSKSWKQFLLIIRNLVISKPTTLLLRFSKNILPECIALTD